MNACKPGLILVRFPTHLLFSSQAGTLSSWVADVRGQVRLLRGYAWRQNLSLQQLVVEPEGNLQIQLLLNFSASLHLCVQFLGAYACLFGLHANLPIVNCDAQTCLPYPALPCPVLPQLGANPCCHWLLPCLVWLGGGGWSGDLPSYGIFSLGWGVRGEGVGEGGRVRVGREDTDRKSNVRKVPGIT